MPDQELFTEDGPLGQVNPLVPRNGYAEGKKAAEKVFDALGDEALKLIVDDRNVLDKVEITSKQKDSIYENKEIILWVLIPIFGKRSV